MKKNVKKITVGGLLIALALVLPMAFHLTGVPQPGQVFLPMHIPVLLGGFVQDQCLDFCRIVFTDYKLCFDGYAGSRQIAVYDD